MPENDKALEAQVEELKKALNEKEGIIDSLRDENAKARIKNRDLSSSLEEMGKKMDEMGKKFDSIDLDEITKLRAEKADAEARKKEAEKAKLLEQGKYEELLKKQKEELEAIAATQAAEIKKQLDAIAAEKEQIAKNYEGLDARHKKSFMEREIISAAHSAQAIDPEDIQLRLTKEIKVESVDGRDLVVVLDDKGEVRRDANGKPLTVAQRVEELKGSERTAHLFKGGKVGTGSKTIPGSDGGTVNPWKKETRNLTEQGRILKENPELAKQMKAEAGLK